MKLKVDQIRTYDDAGFRRRAACLCFRSECESEVNVAYTKCLISRNVLWWFESYRSAAASRSIGMILSFCDMDDAKTIILRLNFANNI